MLTFNTIRTMLWPSDNFSRIHLDPSRGARMEEAFNQLTHRNLKNHALKNNTTEIENAKELKRITTELLSSEFAIDINEPIHQGQCLLDIALKTNNREFLRFLIEEIKVRIPPNYQPDGITQEMREALKTFSDLEKLNKIDNAATHCDSLQNDAESSLVTWQARPEVKQEYITKLICAYAEWLALIPEELGTDHSTQLMYEKLENLDKTLQEYLYSEAEPALSNGFAQALGNKNNALLHSYCIITRQIALYMDDKKIAQLLSNIRNADIPKKTATYSCWGARTTKMSDRDEEFHKTQEILEKKLQLRRNTQTSTMRSL